MFSLSRKLRIKPAFYITILINFITLTIVSQENLIVNGDFENFDICPTSISTPGDYQIEHCLGWYSPTYATSDYFNSCASWPVSVPINTFGSISPQNGNGYCGLLIENCTYSSCNGWWVEYIQSKLLQPLEKNMIYEFSCYIALSNKYYQYSFSEFGINLSPSAIAQNDSKPFNLIPSAINDRGNYITDTINWVEYKTSFMASGNEDYITLGFFIDSTNIDTLFTDPLFDPNNFSSYYYIDNCKLVESEVIFPNIFTPNNDGSNDFWFPKGAYEKIEIINRWGLEVKTIDKGQSWDGNDNNGTPLSEGIYYYYWYQIDHKKAGFIQLIR